MVSGKEILYISLMSASSIDELAILIICSVDQETAKLMSDLALPRGFLTRFPRNLNKLCSKNIAK